MGPCKCMWISVDVWDCAKTVHVCMHACALLVSIEIVHTYYSTTLRQKYNVCAVGLYRYDIYQVYNLRCTRCAVWKTNSDLLYVYLIC